MDRHVIALFIPLLALAIPVAAIIFHGLQKLARTRLEEARLRLGAMDGETGAEIEAEALLQESLSGLRRTLGPSHPEVVAASHGLRTEGDIEPPPT